jgi:Holliday junction resolvasome RuvABC endonuclease subunit
MDGSISPRVRTRMAPMVPLKNIPVTDDVYLGIDPSLVSTGVCMIYRGGCDAFTLRPHKSLKGEARLAWFADEFSLLLRKHTFRNAAIEGYSFGSKGASFNIGEHGGVLRLALFRQGASWAVVPPQTLKKFATGSGTADKEAVSKELFKRFGVDLIQNDAVDAAGLALFAMALDGHSSSMGLTALQLTTLSKADIENTRCLQSLKR